MTAGNQPSNPPNVAAVWANPSEAIERRTASVDATVAAAYERHLAAIAPEGLTLLAVGGFGRRELFPYSDVDLLLLTARNGVSEDLRNAIRAFLQSLWDCGLRVSHSVRTPGDCAELHEHNIELNISLLDQRYLTGDRGLYRTLETALARFLHGQRQALAKHLCRLARERHAKQGNSIYQLEPNIKETPGGLRDYQLVTWLTRLRDTSPHRLPGPAALPELDASRNFLFELRGRLHELAGRDANTLQFDLQDELADASKLSAADWMRRYYSHARTVERAASRAAEAVEEHSSSLLLQFRDWRSRVSNSEFFVSRERVFFRAPQRLEHEPELALRLFRFAGRHGMHLALETERRLAEYLPRVRAAIEQRPAAVWPALEEILAGRYASRALRAMHQTGVLAVIFPEWERIECLVVRDFYHRYTVDEHTLRTIENLEELRSATNPALQRLVGLSSEVEDPALLVLALIFHDTGKAALSGKHAAESIKLAAVAMERLGVPEDKQRAVSLLIEKHLDLSSVMNSRDPEDPATARYLAERAGTLESLKRLTLLTYADIGAVYPGAMTPWRLEQLWRVYLIAYRELTRELETDRIHDLGALTQPGADAFLEGLPVRYLKTHTQAQIEAHLKLAKASSEHGVALDIQRESGFYRLSLIAHDRPALLASVAGALAGFGLNILKAEGFANRHGAILDTFVFSDPHRTLELNPTEMDRLRIMIERVVLGKLDVKELLRNRPVPPPPSKRARIAPTVAFDSQASETATLIEVVAEDRPGLLYALTSTIAKHGANIEVVLIDTEAHKAIDVLYVTSAGKKLTAAQEGSLRGALLAACAA